MKLTQLPTPAGPAEVLHHGIDGQNTVITYLSEILCQPWLPPELKDAADPAMASIYTIGHTALDRAFERAYVDALEEESSMPVAPGVFYRLPTLMNNLLNGTPLSTVREVRKGNPVDIYKPSPWGSLEMVGEANMLLFLPPNGVTGSLEPNHPMSQAWRDALPLDPRYRANKQPPLKFAQIQRFIHEQDVEVSADMLDMRFDHFALLSTFFRAQIMARGLSNFRLNSGTYRLFQNGEDIMKPFIETYAVQLFTPDFLEGQEIGIKMATYFDARATEMELPKYLREGLRTSARYLRNLRWGLVEKVKGFKVAYDILDTPYPPLLSELITARSRATKRAVGSGRRAETSRVEMALPGDVIQPEATTLDASTRKSLAKLNAQADALTGEWTMTHQQRRKTSVESLAHLLRGGVYRRGQALLEPLIPTRAVELASFIHHLRTAVLRDGPEQALNTLLSALGRYRSLTTRTARMQRHAQDQGISSSAVTVHDTPNLVAAWNCLNNPKQWSEIQALLRRVEKSNDTNECINNLLAAFAAREARVRTPNV